MKKIAYILLLVGMAGQPALYAQTDSTMTNQSASPASLNTNAAPAPDTSQAPVYVTTNVTAPTVDAAATNTPPADAAPAAPAPATSIPLIQFSDVPITTAIENLARQANINYMLDPKIGYGQPDATGQIKVEPELSIRWENISAENALIALLDNYGLQLIVDNKTGIDRVAMKDPTAPPELITRVIQLQYASASNMLDAANSTLIDKRSKVLADNRTSQLVVVATEPEQAAVDTLVKQLDTPTKQVLIETKLIEISTQPSTAKGVNWGGTLSAQTVTFGNGVLSGSTTVNSPGVATTTGSGGTPGGGYGTTLPTSQQTALSLLQGNGGFSWSTLSGLIPSTGFLTANGVSAVISFLNQSYNAETMATPRIVTLDNETANIEVTRQYPIVAIGAGTQQSGGSSSVTYSNVGTILQVTPRISANDKIWLKVIPEVSSHFGDQTIAIPGGNGNANFSFTVPIFDVRKMTTQVLIPNGNTLVMGGLVQDAPTASYTKVPVLGDIPGLGWAFRSESKTMDKDNLIIFLTPTIVQDSDFRAAPTTFLQSKAEAMKSPMDPHTIWDSGQPRGNWSDPAPVDGEFDGKPPLNNF